MTDESLEMCNNVITDAMQISGAPLLTIGTNIF